MAELGLIKSMDVNMIQADMFKWLEAEYKRVANIIEDAKKTASPEQKKILDLAKQDLDAFKAASYKLPYLLATPKSEQQIMKINSLYNSALEQAWATIKWWVSAWVDLFPIPKELIEAKWDMQKIAKDRNGFCLSTNFLYKTELFPSLKYVDIILNT